MSTLSTIVKTQSQTAWSAFSGSFSNEDAHVAQMEVPATSIPFGPTETAMLVKMAEYGGFIASVLALCLFFRVLTQFVKQVKDD